MVRRQGAVLLAAAIGDPESEAGHGRQGSGTRAGRAFGHRWRHAVDGGWFSYRLGVEPEGSQTLFVAYWGGDGGRRFPPWRTIGWGESRSWRCRRPERFSVWSPRCRLI